MANDIIVGDNGIVTIIKEASKAVKSLPSYGDWLSLMLNRGYAHFEGLDKDDRSIIKMIDQAKAWVVESAYGYADRTGIPCIGCGLLTCPHCGSPGMEEDEHGSCCEIVPHDTPLTGLVKIGYHEPYMDANGFMQWKRREIKVRVRNREGMKMAPIQVGAKIRTKVVEEESPLAYGLNTKDIRTVCTERQQGKWVTKRGLACRVCQVLYLGVLGATAKQNKEREDRALVMAQVINELSAKMTPEEARKVAGQLPSLPTALQPVMDLDAALAEVVSERRKRHAEAQAEAVEA